RGRLSDAFRRRRPGADRADRGRGRATRGRTAYPERRLGLLSPAGVRLAGRLRGLQLAAGPRLGGAGRHPRLRQPGDRRAGRLAHRPRAAHPVGARRRRRHPAGRRPGARPAVAPAGGIEKSAATPILYRGREQGRGPRSIRGGSLMSTPTTLALLVGGGPAPGINGVISATTIEAVNQGLKVYGVRDGFKHL